VDITQSMLKRTRTKKKSYNGNESKGELGGWGVGSVDTSPAFRKNLVALFRLFFLFFLGSSGRVVLVLISGFACLTFPFYGLGFSFVSRTFCFLIRLDFPL